ncbi:RING finger protein 37 [Geodia barretti]|uniref:RING finger protein 37 n=1 Tax=Geodia barretti TaxID=519541 RepID=A0AA35X299_GEOBA|nr:RING finger protein 37 [Geodia barretti]
MGLVGQSSSYGTRPNESGGRETNSVSVPERFMDEITCEIMVLPMLLPSGHFVDRSTLDKLHTTDCVYGRPPSDPFTEVSQYSYEQTE